MKDSVGGVAAFIAWDLVALKAERQPGYDSTSARSDRDVRSDLDLRQVVVVSHNV
jgi:hypothetical protein